VRRAFRNGGLKCTKTESSIRAVPCRCKRSPSQRSTDCRASETGLLFPAPRGGHLDLHNFRNRDWKPAQLAAGIEPLRRVYDFRHTFATFALRAGISTFDLSRHMGASLTMIDPTTATPPATGASTRSASSTRSTPPSSSGGRWWTLGGHRKRRPSHTL
jgi:hypothetical protein